jgi:hypothetical protein
MVGRPGEKPRRPKTRRVTVATGCEPAPANVIVHVSSFYSQVGRGSGASGRR